MIVAFSLRWGLLYRITLMCYWQRIGQFKIMYRTWRCYAALLSTYVHVDKGCSDGSWVWVTGHMGHGPVDLWAVMTHKMWPIFSSTGRSQESEPQTSASPVGIRKKETELIYFAGSLHFCGDIYTAVSVSMEQRFSGGGSLGLGRI